MKFADALNIRTTIFASGCYEAEGSASYIWGWVRHAKV